MSLLLFNNLVGGRQSRSELYNLDYYNYNGVSGSTTAFPGLGGGLHPNGRVYYHCFTSGSAGYVAQSNLSVRNDISTVDSSPTVLNVGANTFPRDVSWKPDGTKAYICFGGGGTNYIRQYTATTPWNVSTLSYDSKEYDYTGWYDANRGSFTADAYGFVMKDDGTRLVISAIHTDSAYEIDMSTPWDISTADYTSASYFMGGDGLAQPFGIFIPVDGDKMFIGDQNDRDVYEYSLTGSWDIGSAVYTSRSLGASADLGNPPIYEPHFSTDGKYIIVHENGFVTSSIGYLWFRYDYTGTINVSRTAYDLEYTNQSPSSHSFGYNPGGIRFKPDGTKAYAINRTGDTIVQYSLSMAWDSSTMTQDKTFNVASQDTLPNGLFLKPDGTTLYLAGGQNDTIYQYSMSASWDVGSMSLSGSKSVTSQQALPTDVWFSSDGTNMIVVGTADNPINKYTLSQAWTVTSATHISDYSLAHLANASGANYGAWSIDFNSAQTSFIISGYAPYNIIQQYQLNGNMDFSTITFNYQKILSIIDGGAGNPTGINFGNNGTKLYVCSDDNDNLYEYNLT